MDDEDKTRIEELIEIFLEVRSKMGSRGSFRSRVLIDMLLIELGKELAALTDDDQD